jgi:hypothetical protein
VQREPSEKCKHHMMGPKTCHHPKKKRKKKKKKKGILTIRERKIACFNAVFFLTNTEFVFM